MLRAIKGGEESDPQIGIAEYVWTDTVGDFRTKTRVVPVFPGTQGDLVVTPERWGASKGINEERVILSPCFYLPNPFAQQPHFIVLCEVKDSDDNAHPSNQRALLREVVQQEGGRFLCEWGFRQTYVMESVRSLRDERQAGLDHLLGCADAGLMIHSARTDPELPNWEFKVGRRHDLDIGEKRGQDYTLMMCDQLVIARLLLDRAAEAREVMVQRSGTCSVFFSIAEAREDEAILHAVADRIRTAPRLLSRSGQAGESWKPDVTIRNGYVECGNLPANFNPYTIAAFIIKAVSTF